MRVLNEKYIRAQQKNNNNRTNPMTHIYILSVIASSHRAEKEKKRRGENNKGERMGFFFFCSFFLNDTRRHFFSVCLFLSLCRLLLRYALLLELSAFLFFLTIHPSTYLSVGKVERKNNANEQSVVVYATSVDLLSSNQQYRIK